MNKRYFNILFHLHTVSGIIISILLYVIFFAGSFSFFRDEMVNWERNESVEIKRDLTIDVDKALLLLQDTLSLYGRDITISKYYDEKRISFSISASKDTLYGGKGSHFFYFDTDTFHVSSYESGYSLGEFLYRLHFFAQIPYPVGYYLSGFTGLFLLFVLLTGVLIHWEKLVSNFFVFRPDKKLKTIWTDAHTALGTIGLPFQLIYATTGAFFMIKLFLLLPNVLFLYGGNQEKLYKDLGYDSPQYTFQNRPLETNPTINRLVAETRTSWTDFDVTHLHIYNYGDAGMHIAVEGELKTNTKFTGSGEKTFTATGIMISETNPYRQTTYLDGVKNILYRLHFGDYGGYLLKTASFILGILSCFVIITGILIWLEARDKKNIPEREKCFNKNVGYSFLAICLSLFPVTAFSFIVVKLLPPDLTYSKQTILYNIFFGAWLFFSLFFWFKKDNYLTNKYTLLSGGVLGLFVPITTGIHSGTWLWNVSGTRQYDSFTISLLWLFISVFALYAVYKSSHKRPQKINLKS